MYLWGVYGIEGIVECDCLNVSGVGVFGNVGIDIEDDWYLYVLFGLQCLFGEVEVLNFGEVIVCLCGGDVIGCVFGYWVMCVIGCGEECYVFFVDCYDLVGFFGFE